MIGRAVWLATLAVIGVAAASWAAPANRTLMRWLAKTPPIREITIEGNTFFPPGMIESRMYSKTSSLWRRLKSERRIKVQRETAGRDSLEIAYLYLTEGFLGVQISEEFVPIGRDSAAQVLVHIHEGRRFFFGPVKVQGTYPPRHYSDLSKIAAELKPGTPMNPFQIRDAEFRIKEILANNGYPYAQIITTLDTAGSLRESPVTFDVTAESLVHIGQISIQGMHWYPERVARRELKIAPGQIYKRSDIVSSQQRLYQAGYFSTLALVRDDNSPDSLRPNFILKVREREPMYATLSTGAAQSPVRDFLWDFSASFGKRNFLQERRAELSASYSFALGKRDSRLLHHIYQLRYTEPWPLGVRMPLDLTGEVRPEVLSAVGTYRISSWALTASTTRIFGLLTTMRWGFQYQSVTITGVPPTLEDLQKNEGVSGRRQLSFALHRDSRVNFFVPDRGVVGDISLQYFGGVLGGDENFAKGEASWSRYEVVWPGWIAATRLKAGWADAFGTGKIVPIEDRFYLGGASTVRGFLEGTLGPSIKGTPTGARKYLLANQEFRWKTVQVLQKLPVVGSFFETFPLYQSIFFDAGNGFNNWNEVKFNTMAYSYGTGVQLVTPAGPLRLDYGRIIPTKSVGEGHRWHFTILYAF